MSLILPADTDELLDRDEATRALGYRNRRTLIRHEKLGTAPPCIRFGHRVYYRSAALRQHLLSQERAFA